MLMFFYFFLLFFHIPVLSLELGQEISTPKVRILLHFDAADRYKYIDSLKAELQMLEQKWKESSDAYDQKETEIKSQLEELKALSIKKHDSCLLKKINWMTRLDSVIGDIKETRGQTIALLRQHVDFWGKYLSDSMHQSNMIEEKSLYSFLDLQNMMRKIFLQEEQLDALSAKKEEKSIEISREEYTLAAKEKEFEHVEQSIEQKKKQTGINKEDIVLLDLEKEVVVKQRELAVLRLSLHQKNQEFFNSKESILQDKLSALKEQVLVIRNHLYVDISDVYGYGQKSNELKKICEAKKAELIKVRNEIATSKITAQEDLDRLRKRFKISFTKMKQLEDMEVNVHGVMDNFAYYSVARAYVKVATYERMLYKIKIEMMLQDSKMQQAQIVADTVKLLYEVSQGQTKDTETFEKERLEYTEKQLFLTSEIKANKGQVVTDHGLIKDIQRIMTHLKKQQERMNVLTDEVSAFQKKKWMDCAVLLAEMIKNIEEQDEIMLQKSEFFEQIIVAQEESLESIGCILHEFDVIGVWHRSISAVTWDGIKNILPNLSMFVKDIYDIVKLQVADLSVRKIAFSVSKMSVGGLFGMFFLMFLSFLLYLFLQGFLPALYKSLLVGEYGVVDLVRGPRQMSAVAVGFVVNVFTPAYVWMLLFLNTCFTGPSAAFYLLFYGYTIVFGVFAARRLLAQFIFLNRKFDYFLLSKRLVDRFSLVFSFFSISTVVILVFRKMFMMVMVHQQSEFPNILLRVYHVVIFTSIIFSFDREEFLQLLPRKSNTGIRIAFILERYYYLVMFAIFSLLVISDPYLGGYGSLMWHLFWNVFVSICIAGLLFFVHMIIRKYSVIFFFKEDDSLGGSSERFDYAKTWYAIYILCLIFVFAIVAIVLCAEVWGYGFTYGTLRKVAMYELFKIESTSSAGKMEPFRVFNLLYILFMSCVGILLAYLFRKFVLRRVFDIQYVDPGIQNTVTIISRHVIIIAAVMIACIQSKLGSVVAYVSFVGLVTFGWSFKDLLTDFVAYFFILVQRPVKLGDYVKIDQDTMGVVRKISSRAVILRHKNAVNIVVPNSTVLKASIYNWNYSRGYIGLDDILFTVPFSTNIALVRDICIKVLDEDGDVLKVPQPFVRLSDFGDKGYVFMVRGFVSAGNTLRQWDIASNIRFALVEKLGKEGIKIAGPSMRIFMEKDTFLNQQ